MKHSRSPSAASKAIVAKLAEPARIASLGPVAARFIYSIRLVALHERRSRDPVPELASRLGSLDLAAKSLAMAHTIRSVWPEDIHVLRFCCGLMSHDEATIGALIDSAHARNREQFGRAVEGLVRPDRAHRLWDAAQDLVVAELGAA